MTKLKTLKILMQIFLANPRSRLSWNFSILSVGIGTAYMLLFMDPDAGGAAYQTLIGPLILGMGVIVFLDFFWGFLTLVVLKFTKYLVSNIDLDEYIENYGYSPTPKLKKIIKSLDKKFKKDLKKIIGNEWSPVSEYEATKNYEKDKRLAEKLDKDKYIASASKIKFDAEHSSWWNSKSFGVYILIFVFINIFISFYLTAEKTHMIILRNPESGNIPLFYEVFMGILFSLTYNSFRIRLGKGLYYTIPSLLKSVCIFFMGFVVGAHMFNYAFTGFINEKFGKDMSFELSAQYWRQSKNWCEGVQVNYASPGPLFREPNHGERIICFPASYKNSIKLKTTFYAHGPGTVLGMNVHDISSPENSISRMPTPEWD